MGGVAQRFFRRLRHAAAEQMTVRRCGGLVELNIGLDW